MYRSALASNLITRPTMHRLSDTSQRADSNGIIMSLINQPTQSPASCRPLIRGIAALITFLIPFVVSFVAAVGFTTTAALACACGCSVFDVGGLQLPQEQDHGGSVFLEYWSQDQTQNYVGSSRAPASLNTDKEINTQWINVGFTYMFNRDWGVMTRIPTTNRTLTTDTQTALGIQSYNTKDVGDIEVMGMYTGFFNDMSTGVMFGLKLPTGTFNAPGLDRDSQIGTGSTDLQVGAFHRGLLTGDNAWQYFGQVMWRQPFLYQAAADPQGFFDGNGTLVQTYYPGAQIDGAVGIIYNNWYHVGFLDKITPLAQVILSHRDNDTGTGADPYNSGFDRVMLSPGVEFTKVVDEANNRVVKTYIDVEIPVYYRGNAANNAGTEGQLVAPYAIKLVTSYMF